MFAKPKSAVARPRVVFAPRELQADFNMASRRRRLRSDHCDVSFDDDLVEDLWSEVVEWEGGPREEIGGDVCGPRHLFAVPELESGALAQRDDQESAEDFDKLVDYSADSFRSRVLGHPTS